MFHLDFPTVQLLGVKVHLILPENLCQKRDVKICGGDFLSYTAIAVKKQEIRRSPIEGKVVYLQNLQLFFHQQYWMTTFKKQINSIAITALVGGFNPFEKY